MNDSAEFFHTLSAQLLEDDTVTRGTMMGFPCLRVNGDFFASAERNTGHLIIKLPKTRVQDLIDTEVGEPFAPNGRRFKEWVLIPSRDEATWLAFMQEARRFVEGNESL